MKDAIKIMLMPIVGIIGIGIIFLLVVWAGNFQHKIENQNGKYVSASKDLSGYVVFNPTRECDDSYFPVCGFDGVTYDNACKALNNDTKVAHRGICQG